MSESVNLPALGESVTEGTVTRWLKNVGDRVEVDEPLLEVSTDKVDTEIPSPIAGIIEAILVVEDETVEVGTPLVTIGTGSDSADAEPEAPGEVSAEAPQPEPAQPEAAQPEPAQPVPAQQNEAPQEQAAPTFTSSFAPPAETSSVTAPVPEDAQPAATADASKTEPAAEVPSAEVPSTDAPAPEEAAPAAPAAPVPATQIDPAPASYAPAPTQPPASQSNTAGSAQHSPAQEASAQEASAQETSAQETSDQETAVSPAPAQPAPTQPAPAQPAPAQAASVSATPPAAEAHPGYVTPLVRKLAHEKGIDLSTLAGSGVGGRIRKEDVLAAAPAEALDDATAPAPAPTAPVALDTSPLRGTSVPMSRLRKVIAERAVISMQSSAQLTSVVEVDVTLVAQLRDRVKADFVSKTGIKLSFLPFFALAAAEALKAFPIINATIDGDTIVYPPQENMAIAVDTERGLLTPVIRDASSLDLAGLAGQIADLAARTRDNKLKPDELAGGTFTVTNTGSRGALFDTPIVFLPQSAILGTGIVVKKPVVVSSDGGDAIAVRSMVYLALSYDHRIVDGADAARFLVAVKNRLEKGDFVGNLGI